jgi:anti-sigma regulatory factor (Ser/Thr protein kinase)
VPIDLAPDAAPLRLSLLAEPQAARLVRTKLRAWLRTLSATESETFDLLVASGEAVANAVEHPVERRTPMIVFSAERREGGVLLTISDSGHWKAADRRSGRSKGLVLMGALMDKVEIAKTRSGTTITLRRDLAGRRLAVDRLGVPVPTA